MLVIAGRPAAKDKPSCRAGGNRRMRMMGLRRETLAAATTASTPSVTLSEIKAVTASHRAPIDATSASTPKVPTRLSRMIESFCSMLRPPPRPSAVSARPSSWSPRVNQTEARTASSASTSAGK